MAASAVLGRNGLKVWVSESDWPATLMMSPLPLPVVPEPLEHAASVAIIPAAIDGPATRRTTEDESLPMRGTSLGY